MTSSKLSTCKASALILGVAVLLTGPLTSIALAHGHHHHHRHGVRILIGGGPGYYYGYGNSCRWLKLRALETGSPYWWKRYRFCVYG